MRSLRAMVRLFALVIMTTLLSASFLLVRILLTSRAKALAWRNWNVRAWARATVYLLNIKVKAINLAPDEPFLLVSNHLSYIDIVILASRIDCAFIAKSEVAAWPVIGRLGCWTDTVFINRRRKRDVISAMHQMQQLIDAGLGVVLFAEGTSTSGQQVSPFKSATLELAAQHHVPVHYASISYKTPDGEASADQSVCWWGDMTFGDHFFRLLQLSGFEATLTFGLEPIVDEDRHQLASRLWQAVTAQFIPVQVSR